jgi:hypothetical protein
MFDFTGVMNVLAHLHSPKDTTYTYYTSQFPQWKFNSGDEYLFVYDNGDVVYMRASREGRTLYAVKNGRGHSQLIPAYGKGIRANHKVVAISKVLKQLAVS